MTGPVGPDGVTTVTTTMDTTEKTIGIEYVLWIGILLEGVLTSLESLVQFDVLKCVHPHHVTSYTKLELHPLFVYFNLLKKKKTRGQKVFTIRVGP